jgi:CBS domain-containing protein
MRHFFSSRKPGEPQGALGERVEVARANHARVAEPTVASVLSQSAAAVPAVAEDAMVLDALKVMTEFDCAAVAVMSAGGLVGVFSERDLARNYLLGNGTTGDTPVIELMTDGVDCACPDQSVSDCLAVMNGKGLAIIPVLDRGMLLGLVSQTDLLKAQLAFHERVFHETELDQKLLYLRGTYSC